MRTEFSQETPIAAATPANADLTTSAFGGSKYKMLSVIFTTTDLNQADATVTLQARHKVAAYWVVIGGPTALTATAGAKSYKFEVPSFLYDQARLVYSKGTVTVGTITATSLSKD